MPAIERKVLKIVIIGHVDHGKSTLIGRIMLDTGSLPKDKTAEIKKISRELGKDAELAFLADQLKEERERSITIDTTQVFFKTRKRDYVIIDAPGHLEFIKNMLTGATQAEAAVLLVDANEGVMEQTRRHIYLIDMLGIDRIIVVLNKMDLVGYRKEIFDKVKNELDGFLKIINVTPSYFIPVSAKEGENISGSSKKLPWYKGVHFLKALDSLRPKEESKKKPLRFSVQDVYRIEGNDLAAGRVESGTIAKKQKVVILPKNIETEVEAIKVFKKEKKSAEEGECVGIILKDSRYVKRGCVISQKRNAPTVVKDFKGHLFWMSSEPLELGKELTLRCATQEIRCTARKIERKFNTSTLEVIEENAGILSPNEVGEIYFRTEEPLLAEKFSFIENLGRFIVESDTGVDGAGIVV